MSLLKRPIDLGDFVGNSKHFMWYEVLWLPTWQIFCFPSERQYIKLIKIVNCLDQIRNLFNKPIWITSGLRPKEYNKVIKGAKNSAHKLGEALDFCIKGFQGSKGCDEVRQIIVPMLESIDIRMEDLKGSNWIHIDIRSPSKNRFFIPYSS